MAPHKPNPCFHPPIPMASTVIAVVLRVAGHAEVEVQGHHLGTPERQVTA